MLTTDTTTDLPLVGDADGGLARRQMLRQVKERMESVAFQRGVVQPNKIIVPRGKMQCGECIERKARNVRSYRTWSELRNHLVDHHGFDRREVPE